MLVQRNVEEIKRISLEPLMKVKKSLERQCSEYLWAPTFRRDAATITHTALSKAVALEHLTLKEPLKTKVVESFITSELSGCLDLVKFNLFAKLFRGAIVVASVWGLYLSFTAWNMTRAFLVAILLCVALAQPATVEMMASSIYWVFRLTSRFVSTAVLVCAICIVVGGFVVRASMGVSFTRPERAVPPRARQSPNPYKRYSYSTNSS